MPALTPALSPAESTRDANRFEIERPEDAPACSQDRAVPSLVWNAPERSFSNEQ
jgi:hypothetical protein